MTSLRYLKLIIASILLSAIMILFSSVNSEENHSEISATSVDSHFQATCKSKLDTIPLNKIHPWILHITNKEGQPVERATISIDGGMPAHNHGLPTQPIATEIGGGDYLVEGLKFSMTGSWEIWFYIQTDSVSDKVKVTLQL